MRCVEAVDRLRERGEHLKEYPRDERGHIVRPNNIDPNNIGLPTHQQTAQTVGVSPNDNLFLAGIGQGADLAFQTERNHIFIIKFICFVFTSTRPSVTPLSFRHCSTWGVMLMKARRPGTWNQSSLR